MRRSGWQAVVLAMVIVLCVSQACLAKTPPGKWPRRYYLWYNESIWTFHPALLDLWAVSEEEAIQGTISPNGKYIAYTARGPYLVIRTFEPYHEEFTEIARIPWGVSPMWLPDSSAVYFAKTKEVDDLDDFNWIWNVAGMYKFDMKTKKESLLLEGNYYPGSVAPDNETFAFTYVKITKDTPTETIGDFCVIRSNVSLTKPLERWVCGIDPLYGNSVFTDSIVLYGTAAAAIGLFAGDYDNVQTFLEGQIRTKPGGFTSDDKYLFVSVPVPWNPAGPVAASNVRWYIRKITMYLDIGDFVNQASTDESFLERQGWSFKDISIRRNSEEFVVASTLAPDLK